MISIINKNFQMNSLLDVMVFAHALFLPSQDLKNESLMEIEDSFFLSSG